MIDVVDGDTIVVVLDQDGEAYSVRYIGMDTPENTTQIEPFGPEATAKNRELVGGKTVALFKDVSETDRFGRLLRYVIADGIFVNYELVAQGYANVSQLSPGCGLYPGISGSRRASRLLEFGNLGQSSTFDTYTQKALRLALPLPARAAGTCTIAPISRPVPAPRRVLTIAILADMATSIDWIMTMMAVPAKTCRDLL